LSTPFQNRLVGTIIVAAIAIIFLPDVLDGDKKTYQDNFEAIPAAPKVNFPSEKKNFPQDKLSKFPAQPVSDERAVDDEKTEHGTDSTLNASKIKIKTLSKNDEFSTVAKTTDKDTSALPEKAVPKQAWVIQLGSFRHKNNVNELVNKLKSNGYTVFTKPIKTKNGTLTKVFVGPELIKSSLEKKLSGLKKLTDVQGKISRFYPTK
jgi:DedD protein